jgi:hypothetical protein
VHPAKIEHSLTDVLGDVGRRRQRLSARSGGTGSGNTCPHSSCAESVPLPKVVDVVLEALDLLS